MTNRKRLFSLSIVLFIVSISLSWTGITAKGAGRNNRRVLFISSYSYAREAVQKQIQGINNEITEDIDIDYEFMNTDRVEDDTALELFYEDLSYRLQNESTYDVVILGGDAALAFAIQHRDELFEGVPLLFLGINDKEAALEAAEDPLITGIAESWSPKENIDLGLRLNPNAKKVYAILDDSSMGQAEREFFYDYADEYPELEFNEINASELTSTKLRNVLHNVEKDSILIYIAMSKDASGKEYSDKEARKFLADNSAVPVLCMADVETGDGLLGGYVVSMEQAGEISAQMAMAIMMGGRSPATINVVTKSVNKYMLDETVMKEYGMDLTLIPKDTVIINKTQSYFERNKETLKPAAILLAVMMIVIVCICVDNIRRRKLLQELEEARAIMESASQHDFLTGLPNRSKFMKDFQELVTDKSPCTIMMIDIDDFKSINDNYGHTAGDETLQELASRLKDMQSQILTSYRYAGDEFILILKSNQDKIVEKTAYQCRQVFGKDFMVSGKHMKVCGSIGVASYPKDADDLEQLIICADDAMYQVKKNGKNDFAFYHKKESNT